MELLELSERIFNGDEDIAEHHPFSPTHELAEITPGVAFVHGFANVSVFKTEAGLVMVDTGSPMTAKRVHKAIRSWDQARLNTAIYTHGHIDHVFGTEAFEAEAHEHAWPNVQVVAHRDVPVRFERYQRCLGYNATINRRQFQSKDFVWPADYRQPDVTYSEELQLSIGDVDFECFHARGETDDATWVWVPERKTLCTGDLIIWCTPNAGNPQKVQRFALDWAAALRDMATKAAAILLPGHGYPVIGAARVRAVLEDTAELLEVLHDETLALMNDGARLDDIVRLVKAPPQLLAKPYLRPIYDDPEFIVRGIWRSYGGWYDGDPSHLKPAPASALAAELAALAGGAGRLARRAQELVEIGDDLSLRLAAHLSELATQADPDDRDLHKVRAQVFGSRAETEQALMSKGLFNWAANESLTFAATSDDDDDDDDDDSADELDFDEVEADD